MNRKTAFKAMLAYAKPQRFTFMTVFLFSIIAISADLLQPFIVSIVIDHWLQPFLFGAESSEAMTAGRIVEILLWFGALYLLLTGMVFLFSYWQANLLQRAGQSIVAQLRKDLFHHISRQSMSFFDRHPRGSLVTNVSSDTETINRFFTQVLLSIVRDGMSLILIIGFMFALDVQMALYCMILIPIIVLIAGAFRKALRTAYQRSRTQLSKSVAFVAENLAGMSLIQAFHQEKEQSEAFTQHNRQYLKENLREVRTSVMFNRSFEILGNVSVALVVWIGGLAVLGQELSFGILYAFISYIRQFFQPINHITQQWNTLQATLVSVERLWRIFSIQPEVREPEHNAVQKLEPDEVQGRIDFNQIRFSYTDDQEVLHGLDLHVKPGEFIGIVGTTGAGKSSLVNLLARFYDVKRGSITIDGVDIRSLPGESLHRLVGLVQQEPFLYSGSIIDNVRLFNKEISREDVEAACKFVGAHKWIERLKDGYDTKLSERGSGLSAGERQLLSFARILVYQPRILILDEATANLDSHTEQLIQRALQVVSEGRTTLVIAHRLSTVQHADRIIVMRSGKIVEEGSHEQLMRMNGYYAQLYRHSRGQVIQDIS